MIDTSNPWVDANPKESDFTYVAVGQSVTLDVDAFPNHVFKGTVGSLSPGTGAQFAILPPQNATGNFVKVVQRVPVRIYFDKQRQLRPQAEGRHERLRHHRHQAIAARSPHLFGFAGGGGEGGLSGHAEFGRSARLPFPACAGPW